MAEEDTREEALERAREQLQDSVDRDQLIIKAVKLLDAREENLDEEVEHLRDWYSLHFPELEDEIGDDREFVKLLSRGVDREEMDAFQELADNSTGADFQEEDLEMLEKTVENVWEGFKFRDELEDYIRELCREEIPNLSKLLGPLLAAEILALAGGLEELAKSPSSTVQTLGAEKALFRFLSGEGTPPKHGALFRHRFVSTLPDDTRGKMARFLANKSSIAARLDFYGEKEKGEELLEEAEEKFEELKGG